jgi:hypothetical protein
MLCNISLYTVNLGWDVCHAEWCFSQAELMASLGNLSLLETTEPYEGRSLRQSCLMYMAFINTGEKYTNWTNIARYAWILEHEKQQVSFYVIIFSLFYNYFFAVIRKWGYTTVWITLVTLCGSSRIIVRFDIFIIACIQILWVLTPGRQHVPH